MKSRRIENYKAGHRSEIIFLNYQGKSNKDMTTELTKYVNDGDNFCISFRIESF